MQKLKSIVLLSLMVLALIPWRSICLAHPFGHNHEHHQKGKLTACEMRHQYRGTAPVFFPPMHCHSLKSAVDDFQITNNLHFDFPLEAVVFTAVSFNTIRLPEITQNVIIQIEPYCRSATLIATNLLRGPPLV